MDVRLHETGKDDETFAIDDTRFRPPNRRTAQPNLFDASVLNKHVRIENATGTVHRHHTAAAQQQRFTQGSLSRSVGSNAIAPYWAPQCRCGPVTRPVAPTLAMIWPRSTVSPTATSTRLR